MIIKVYRTYTNWIKENIKSVLAGKGFVSRLIGEYREPVMCTSFSFNSPEISYRVKIDNEL